MIRFEDYIVDQLGNALVGKTVTVRVANATPGSGALATIYSDDGTTLVSGSALTTDAQGRFFFYAPDGKYDLTISGTNITTYVRGAVELTEVASTTLDCSSFAGATAGVQISACITALPAGGGTADVRGILGGTIATDVFTSVTKNVTLLWGAGTYAFTLDTTIPANIAHVMGQGSILAPASSKTLTIRGSIEAPLSQIFGGAGSISFNLNTKVPRLYPQWWNAKGDNATDDQPAIQAAIDAAETFGNSSLNGARVYFPCGWYVVNNPVVLPRTDSTPETVVWLEGENERCVRIGATGSTSFPVGRGVVEWDDVATQAWYQSISNMTITLPNVGGVMGIYYHPTWSDRRIVADAAITATDATLTSATANFTSADVGKVIFVFGAGTDSQPLRSWIRSRTSATEVELQDVAGTTVSGANAMMYQPDGSAYTTLTDGAITGGTTTLTSPGNNFVAGDAGKKIYISGAGFGGLPYATTIASFTNAGSVEVTHAPPTTVSGALVVRLTTDFNEALERLSLRINNVTIEGSNQYHFASIVLGGSVLQSEIKNYGSDPSLGTWKQDTIALMVDELSADSTPHYGNDSVGLQFSNINNFDAGVRRGGRSQALRGRFVNVDMNHVRTGIGSNTNPHYEFINSAHVVFSISNNEGSGAKGVFKLVQSQKMRFLDWSVGSSQDEGYNFGDGVHLIGTVDTIWENGPTRFTGFGANFSTNGKDLILIDSNSHRNTFTGVQTNTTFANEISDSGTGNYIEGCEWTAVRTCAFKSIGTLSRGAISTDRAFTSTLATGTAPFTVASTTKVSNLNVDQLDGGDWASPGAAIGTGTPVAGTFTALTTGGAVTLNGSVSQGTAYKYASVTTGSIGASSSAAVTLTFSGVFTNAAWHPQCSVLEATASTSTLRVHHIESITNTTNATAVVRVVNDDGVSAHTGTLYCTGVSPA